MIHSHSFNRLVKGRAIGAIFPWRGSQKRCQSIAVLATAQLEDEVSTNIEANLKAIPSRLDGISIAYHWRRRQVLEAASATSKNPRIIGIKDPTTGFLYMDTEGISDEGLDYAREQYATTSVAERRRMVMQEMASVVDYQTIAISSKDYSELEVEIKRKLKKQLLDCQTTKDIFRVVAAALQTPMVAYRLARLGEQISRAFFRSRSSASDLSIATRIFVLIQRFAKSGLLIQPVLMTHGLKFAIRSRDIDIVKRYLKELRKRKVELSVTTFRAVIAKCSIGRQGFGEIRNGRWKRDDLLQVLLGFKDAVPGEEYHLGVFYSRSDWQYVAAWSQILSRCGAYDELWQEWLWWKDSEARLSDRPVMCLGVAPATPWTWRQRGDRWFIQVFIDAGLIDWAWTILKETQLDPFTLRRECLHQLLERMDLAAVWNEKLQQALMDKLVEDLAAIEQMMGVKWVQRDGISFHAPLQNCQESLEMLSEPDFFTKYGYFTNDTED